MRRMMVMAVAAIAAGNLVFAAEPAAVSVATMPPSVVKTVPQAGDTAVDPALTEVHATFSKDMLTREMWSWCFDSRETFPEIDASKIHYLKDKRTCVLPVKLEPGKTYVIWINSQKFNSFRDTGQRPAVPYLLVFQTRAQ
ncbi:MAG: Ig-like domain-containing protein [Kiritimatiellae bacterium]|nr:Ig-like domain-containing protein [Kiritimatiellia bacterium]